MPGCWETPIAAPATQVWEALTTPERTRRWFFGLSVDATWRAGSEVIYRDRGGAVAVQGLVERIETERSLSLLQSFAHSAAGSEPPVRITWELHAERSLTYVQLRLEADEKSPYTARTVSAGARILLARLKALLETGRVPSVDTVTFDCRDPWPVARFWQHATGYELLDPGDGGAQLVDTAGTGMRLKFNLAAHTMGGKNRLHLDIGVEDTDRTASELQELGGSILASYPDHLVMADPEGNEFCLR